MTRIAVAWCIAAGAGLLTAVPLVSRGARDVTVRRTHELIDTSRRVERSRHKRTKPLRLVEGLTRFLSTGTVGRVVRALVRRRRAASEVELARRELPLVADLLSVAVGAGCTPYLAVQETVGWAPTTSARHLRELLRACELGAGFDDALRHLGASVPVLLGLTDALATSERTGAPVGAALARTAEEARASVRRSVETRARTVPVRLLFPLVFLVLPAFGLLTVAPALLTAFART